MLVKRLMKGISQKPSQFFKTMYEQQVSFSKALSLWKGKTKKRLSNMHTPKAKESVLVRSNVDQLLESFEAADGFFDKYLIISGAKKEGALYLHYSAQKGELVLQANPKSLSLASPFSKMRTFSSLISLWAKFLLWRY